MKKRLSLMLAILLMFSVTMSCNKQKEPLRLATYTYSTNDRLKNLQPLADDLAEQLKRPVSTTSYPDVASFIKGLKSNSVDIALINTLGYLLLSLNNEHMNPVAVLKVRQDAVDNYKTVLLTTKMDIADLDDVKEKASGLSMMFVAEGSTSGNLVPRLLFSSMGLNAPKQQFKHVSYGGNHTSTLERLLAGEADLCAIGSNEYFKQLKADSTLKTATRLLWISKEIPLGPVLLNKRLANDEQQQITKRLLQLHDADASVLQSIKAGWSEAKQAEKFYAITDNYYDNFRMVNGNTTDLAEILAAFVK
ncbi:MAG: phosphate/phosphite/phosphonate ABC transporter substrate-binding protein [Calditrichia bacterium]